MELKSFFEQNPSGALAFSGGTDSSLLVWAAAKYGKDWHAYYVHSAFQPAFELADARKIASQCQLPLTIIEADILRYPEVAANPLTAVITANAGCFPPFSIRPRRTATLSSSTAPMPPTMQETAPA